MEFLYLAIVVAGASIAAVVACGAALAKRKEADRLITEYHQWVLQNRAEYKARKRRVKVVTRD